MGERPTTLIDGRTFVEAPRWHENRIWFSELYTHKVMSAREDGTDLRVEATVPQQPSGIAWLPDGRLLVVSMRDRRLMRREYDGTLVVHADLSEHATGFCNEVIVDDQGRAYVGNFGFDLVKGGPMTPASIHRVDPDGTITEVADDIWFPNGCVLTDDGVFIVNETFGNRISAFDLTEDGWLVNRRVWAEFGQLPAATTLAEATPELVLSPDGMCRDAEGALWIADLTSQKILRMREGGEVVDEIDPGMMPFSAALGGSDGHTMFICAAPDFDEEDRRATTLAAVLQVRVDVPAA
ncbi:sugar lactone lactonase YvrE [Kribbella sp. VKM Ac-2527]|uniref:Sugar lactone lactonase YvrE n=1 Tax=Kribbella caucasensis TaxID=2512215 RepID=A0A4R6KK08_9ACTN|nr:SMP-30/gluconolactonase/LRE family protein [Kribbella sp. VKM Ac-2527]TDO51654.1 sugar lactone lactonase YvrE [Kribbella sp. VKM Ac-2527]